jgi:hypothetical protein
MWCQEQGYDKDRCERRDAADVAAFEEYWRQVEKYEEKYYTDRQNYANFKEELNRLDQREKTGFDGYDPKEAPQRPY